MSTAAAATASTTTQVYRVFIKATPEAVWDAITKSEWVEKYGYGGSCEFDLRAGGKYQANASAEMLKYGMPEVMIVGEVIEANPPRKLVQTWHPLWSPESAAEKPTTLTYEIDPQPNGTTRLTVTHDLAGAPSLVDMISGQNEQAGGGWAFVLSDLKSLLETGKIMA
jgi:uncharacterized protein YndB with AHSA1/START domain